ncbi:homogentisate geranylgeranyltransferase, chloroplastic-like isoform X4 [Vigna angularis]|uniref:homogentisate geranylgeranyltransferase, chloroplastic-like isoform X4 n=1 Tax=Phaseolus angularis TaxID=3914 RepID=UPI00080A0A7B|nr:homogentisate geranylgeranyltransferase, chloroplastic-like isoform X4 [Vigna angularis]
MLRTPTLENHFNLLNLNIFQNPFGTLSNITWMHLPGNKHNFYVSPCSREVMRYFSNIFRWLVPGRSSCCFKSGYVIGLNHLTDVEIDKINKPYRPLASREYSFGAGVLLTASCLILVPPLLWALSIHFFLGTASSIDRADKVKRNTCQNSLRCLLFMIGFGLFLPNCNFLRLNHRCRFSL